MITVLDRQPGPRPLTPTPHTARADPLRVESRCGASGACPNLTRRNHAPAGALRVLSRSLVADLNGVRLANGGKRQVAPLPICHTRQKGPLRTRPVVKANRFAGAILVRDQAVTIAGASDVVQPALGALLHNHGAAGIVSVPAAECPTGTGPLRFEGRRACISAGRSRPGKRRGRQHHGDHAGSSQ